MTDTEKIRQFLLKRAAKSGSAPVALEGNTRLFGNVLDSFGILELAAFIEESFDVRLEQGDLGSARFDTLDGIAALIKAKKSAKRPA